VAFDFLASIQNPIKMVLSMLMNTKLVGTQITYNRHLKDEFDREAKTGKATFDPFEDIPAARTSHSVESAAAIGKTNVEAGDTIYIVETVNVPDNISLKDEIVEGTEVFSISHIQWIPQKTFSLAVVFTCKGS
jgi:hypothetical protein